MSDPDHHHEPYFPPNDGYDESQYRNMYSPPPQDPQHHSYDPHSGHPIPPGYVPPHRPPPSSYDPNYFPPPPRDEYRDNDYNRGPPPSDYDRGYDRAAPSDYDGRPYAPSEPYMHEGNQMAPYDEMKAQTLQEEQRQRYGQPPPPPSDYDERDPRYDDRDRRYDDRRDDRYYDDRDRRSYSDDRSYYDDRDRRDDRRRRDSRASPTKTGKDIFGSREGQRGISAQILGGAMGGFAGHEFGGGVLETLGGIAVGALGAKALENQHEKRKTKKDAAMRNAAPFKDDAVSGRRRYSSSYPSRTSRSQGPGDDRTEYSRDRRSSRRGGSRPPRYADEDSYYSDDYSPSPPRRRRTGMV